MAGASSLRIAQHLMVCSEQQGRCERLCATVRGVKRLSFSHGIPACSGLAGAVRGHWVELFSSWTLVTARIIKWHPYRLCSPLLFSLVSFQFPTVRFDLCRIFSIPPQPGEEYLSLFYRPTPCYSPPAVAPTSLGLFEAEVLV
jgi:hypothetical protein